jgi:hypothetical protein
MESRMSRRPESDHDWFRRRLPDHLLDLLPDGDRRRFEAHARRCPGCAKLLASALGARADWWDGAGHPPVGVLLDWDPSARGEATHDAVRSHLSACEDCRRDVADLRGEALLSEVALAPVRSMPAPARRRPAIRWGGLAAVAATFAAVATVLWVRPRDTARAPEPPTAGAPAVPVTPSTPSPQAEVSPPPPAAAPGLEAAPVTLVAVERGSSARPTRVSIPPGAARVSLTLPALATPDGVVLEIVLRDAAGTAVSRQWLPAERALRAGGVELEAAGLAEGAYVLAVRWIDPVTGEESREFALDVRLSRPR